MHVKKISWIFCFLCLFTGGLFFLLYPTVSDYWNSFHQSQVIVNYDEAVKKLDAEEYAKRWEDAKEYNKRVAERGILWNMTEQEILEYKDILNINDSGMMGYVQIPSIGCSLPIYHGTDEAVLQVATGHIGGSSFPVGGKSTHCMISGHSGLPSARLFTDLNRLKKGDSIILVVLNETLTYKVVQIRTVLPDEVDTLRIEESKDLCTLITCTPYGINSHRLLVTGQRAEDGYDMDKDLENIRQEGGEKVNNWSQKIGQQGWNILFILICFFCFVIPVKAKEQVDVKTKAAITLAYEKGKTAFSFYKVADVTKGFQFVPTTDFEIYGQELKAIKKEKWQSLAETMAAYVRKQKLSPFVKTGTNDSGEMTLSGLSTGLYLVIGEAGDFMDEQYTPIPFLISLPSQTQEGEWDYHPVVHPKYEKTEVYEEVMENYSEVLPQTGQLWWPVVVLLGIGFLVLGVYFVLVRKR